MKNIKNLHIIANEVFTQPFIDFINANFNSNDHLFLIVGGMPEEKIKIRYSKNTIKYKGIFYKNRFIMKASFFYRYLVYFKFLYRFCDNSEKIYFHNLFNDMNIFFLYTFRKFLKRATWIPWGGDIYCYEKRNKYINHPFYYLAESYVKRNIANVSTLVPEDYDLAKKYYKVKGKYYLAEYPFNTDFKFIDSLVPKKKDDIYIQIGNSADPSNNHKEILDDILKFREKNIKIFCVLSYGNMNYADEIIKYGKMLFGKKFIPITKFMSYDDYWRYMKDIDILIFDHRRQQGLGNLCMLSYLEKKVFLRDDISSWNYLTNDLKLKLSPYGYIKKQQFSEFIRNNSAGNKEKLMKTIFSNDYVVNLWKKIFEDI